MPIPTDGTNPPKFVEFYMGCVDKYDFVPVYGMQSNDCLHGRYMGTFHITSAMSELLRLQSIHGITA